MKHQYLAYVIVGLLSIGAGVAIAGLPNKVPVDATIIAPTTTDAPERTLPEPVDTVAPEETTPDTKGPEAPASSTTTTSTTTAPDTTDSVSAGLPARGEIATAAANGANVDGAALRMVNTLTDLGYVDVRRLNGSDIFEFTTIYFAPGFEEAAQRAAADLQVVPDFVAPIADAPNVADVPANTELLVYVGRDRA